VPYFGICLGMQTLAVEFARNVCKLKNANSTEFDHETPHPIISLLEEQKGIKELGGTMRLGAYPCKLVPGTLAAKAYSEKSVNERHRHRYEFNNAYREIFEKNGVVFGGTSPDGSLVEICEIKGHPWMVGEQFHPEFKSKPTAAHPLFRDFVRAAVRLKGRPAATAAKPKVKQRKKARPGT
jgi:CTP synthase